MKHLIRTTTFLALVALTVAPAMAQRGGGAGGGRGGAGGGRGGAGGPGGGMRANADMIMLGLLRQEAIQEEIEMSPDQIEKIEEIGEGMRGERPDMSRLRDASQEEREKLFAEMRTKMEEQMKAARENVAKVLSSGQQMRLNQIAIQLMGTAALSDPKVIEKLNITDAQKEEMEKIREETRTSFRELFTSGDRDQIREKMAEAREQEQEKVMGVLTAEQKTQFEELKGEPSEAVAAMQSQGGRGGFGAGLSARGGDRGGAAGGRGGRGNRGGERTRPEADTE